MTMTTTTIKMKEEEMQHSRLSSKKECPTARSGTRVYANDLGGFAAGSPRTAKQKSSKEAIPYLMTKDEEEEKIEKGKGERYRGTAIRRRTREKNWEG